MIKKSKISTDSSPYLKHIEQDNWDDINAHHIEDSNVWKRIAVISLIGAFIVCLYSMYLINQDKHKTLVFEKDSLGNIQALGIASRTLQVDNKLIAHQLMSFITALREVPLDLNIKRKNIELVHKMIDPKLKTTIDQMLVDEYTKAKNNATNYVQINNIKPLAGGKSWEIRWTETFNSGDELVTHWDAVVSYRRLATTDINTEMINPAGLFIDYISVTQDMSDKAQ